MATFAYSGRTRAGQNVVGERIAESMDAAVSALRREQILVTIRHRRSLLFVDAPKREAVTT